MRTRCPFMAQAAPDRGWVSLAVLTRYFAFPWRCRCEARHIELAPVLATRAVDLVLVGANDPAAMLAHTEEARGLGVPFAADPSQRLPRLDRDACRVLVDGARYLFTNEYEWELLTRKTGWDADEIMRRVGLRVTIRADKGCLLATADGPEFHVDAVPAHHARAGDLRHPGGSTSAPPLAVWPAPTEPRPAPTSNRSCPRPCRASGDTPWGIVARVVDGHRRCADVSANRLP